jgi:peptidoglycan/LPS O-acetylase OafA/YrhL
LYANKNKRLRRKRLMQKADRLHALDAVRAFALLLGVVHHAALSFLPIRGLAPVEDVSQSNPLRIVSYVGHNFRMPLFFLMAGLFGRMMLHRRGARGFCADRLQRILVPLVVGWIVFFPMINAIWSYGLTGSIHHSPLLPWPPSLATVPTSYLWFLYYLLLIYGLMLLARVIVLRVPEATLAGLDTLIRQLVSGRWLAPVALTIPIVVVLALVPRRTEWAPTDGILTPNSTLIPALLPLFAYALTFAVGWMFARNMDLLALLSQRWRPYLTAALVAIVVCMTLNETGLVARGRVPGMLCALSYFFASWCWIFAIVGMAVRFLSTASPVRRYLADASYWIYLLHYPIVLVLQDALAEVRWHWLVKFPLILGITFTICLVTYHFFVRFTIIGRVLNGRRASRPSTLTPPAPAT